MKKITHVLLTVVVIFFFHSLSITAQERTNSFDRKGKVLVETGYNLVGGLLGGSTGFYLTSNEGQTITSLGLDGGYFISQNLAIKARLGLLTTGESLTSFSIGAKYYIAGTIPIDIGVGGFSFIGETVFQGVGTVGYGIRLAPNINLEPKLGVQFISESTGFTAGVGFSMFL